MAGTAIREIMTANPVVLMADTPIQEAARAMRERDIGDVIVQKDGKVCGIVTDRDIVVRAIAENKDPARTPLESICSKDVSCLSPDDTDDKAIRLMREKSIRRIPVMDGQRAVGIVSLGDLAVDKDPRSVLGHVSAARPNK
jgi:CBS domain-containing protein